MIFRLFEICIEISKDGWTPDKLNANELIDILMESYPKQVDMDALKEFTGSHLPTLFYESGNTKDLLRVMLDIHFTRFNGVKNPGKMAHYYKFRYLLGYFNRSADLNSVIPEHPAEKTKANILEQLVFNTEDYERCPTELLKNYDEGLKFSEKLFKFCCEMKKLREKEINKDGPPTPEEKFDLILRFRLNFKRASIYGTLAKMSSKMATKEKLYRKSVASYWEDRKEVVSSADLNKYNRCGALR